MVTNVKNFLLSNLPYPYKATHPHNIIAIMIEIIK